MCLYLVHCSNLLCRYDPCTLGSLGKPNSQTILHKQHSENLISFSSVTQVVMSVSVRLPHGLVLHKMELGFDGALWYHIHAKLSWLTWTEWGYVTLYLQHCPSFSFSAGYMSVSRTSQKQSKTHTFTHISIGILWCKIHWMSLKIGLFVNLSNTFNFSSPQG